MINDQKTDSEKKQLKKSLAYMAADERTMQSVSLDDNNQEPYAER